jgi:hypothetical protein
MSYEELVEARAKYAEKESAKGKKRRGRKPKSGMPETGEGTADTVRPGRKRKSAVPEPKAKVARISNVPESARGSVAQMSETQVAACQGCKYKYCIYESLPYIELVAKARSVARFERLCSRGAGPSTVVVLENGMLCCI